MEDRQQNYECRLNLKRFVARNNFAPHENFVQKETLERDVLSATLAIWGVVLSTALALSKVWEVRQGRHDSCLAILISPAANTSFETPPLS